MSTIKTIFKYIVELVIASIFFILIQVPTAAEMPRTWSNESAKNPNMLAHILLLVISTIFIFTLLYIFSKFVGNKLDFKKRISVKGILIACAGTVISQFIQWLLSCLSKTASGDSDIINSLHTPLWWILLIELFLISPILEEMLFQGILQKGIFQSFNPIVSIIFTSLLFALGHGYSLSIGTLALFASGLAYAIVYQETGDIKMAILAHGLSNVIVVILDLL